MNAPDLGKLITGEAYRDAIHIAVAPVEAGAKLIPGQHVSIIDGKAYGGQVSPIGIVDPFLNQWVAIGEKFYLFLYPNTITSLRHEWVHPAFSDNALQNKVTPSNERAAAEQWLREYAVRIRPYDKMFNEADAEETYARFMESVRDGDIFYYGRDCHCLEDVKDADELFKNLSIVLGRHVNGKDFSYSCSC